MIGFRKQDLLFICRCLFIYLFVYLCISFCNERWNHVTRKNLCFYFFIWILIAIRYNSVVVVLEWMLPLKLERICLKDFGIASKHKQLIWLLISWTSCHLTRQFKSEPVFSYVISYPVIGKRRKISPQKRTTWTSEKINSIQELNKISLRYNKNDIRLWTLSITVLALTFDRDVSVNHDSQCEHIRKFDHVFWRARNIIRQ